MTYHADTSVPTLTPEKESLEDIFGPTPSGGEFVATPDNPAPGPTFSPEMVERIASNARRSVLDGSWEDIYREILRDVNGLVNDRTQ